MAPKNDVLYISVDCIETDLETSTDLNKRKTQGAHGHSSQKHQKTNFLGPPEPIQHPNTLKKTEDYAKTK